MIIIKHKPPPHTWIAVQGPTWALNQVVTVNKPAEKQTVNNNEGLFNKNILICKRKM